VIGPLARGGAEQQLFELVTRLDRNRFEPQVCSLDSGYEFVEPFRKSGVPVLELPRRGSWDLSRLAALRRVLLRERPDLVHAFLPAPGRYLGLACLSLRKPPPYILSERATTSDRSRTDLWIDRRLAPRATLHLANADSVRRALERLLDGVQVPIRVVPNGIDAVRIEEAAPREATRRALGWAPDESVLLSVGRLVAAKDVPTLLRAIAQVAPGRRLRLALAGDGPERPRVEALCRELPFPVDLLGTRSDVPDLLRAADLFVLASVTEGFPNVVGEALLAGLPIAVTAAGGIPEIVSDGVHGRVVPVGDSDALARAVAELLDDGAYARRLAAAGREHVARCYSVDAMVARVQEIYHEILAGHAAPGA
jgi:glycosyltransferase involved in cell wall biosynthesis